MKRYSHWIMLALGALMMTTPMFAFAQDAFSSAPSGQQMAQNATGTVNAFYVFIQALVCLAGFLLVCKGLYTFWMVSKENGQGQNTIGKGLTGCGIGVLMIMLPLTVGTLGKSVFGDQAARPRAIELAPQ